MSGMGTSALWLGRLLSAACLVSVSLSFPALAATENELDLHRGIAVNPWFTRPKAPIPGAGRQTLFPKIPPDHYYRELKKLRDSGFDFLRVPVAAFPLTDVSQEIRTVSISDIGATIDVALKLGFNILYDYHIPTSGVGTAVSMFGDSKAKARYLELMTETVEQIVEKNRDRIILEVMNEPNVPCDDPKWFRLQKEIVDHIRSRYAGIKLALTGGCLSSYNALQYIDLQDYADKQNLYYTFHYYRPFWFTHQAATWSGGPGVKLLTGLPWPPYFGFEDEVVKEIRRQAPANSMYKLLPPTALEQAEEIVHKYYRWNPNSTMLAAEFAEVGSWADANAVPRSHVILGEFGVLKRERRWKGADIGSAARWIAFVRQRAEQNGFPWSMWSYKEGMALAVSDDGTDYYPEIVQALGLSSVGKHP